MKDPVEEYLELAERRPELFAPAPENTGLGIVLDEARIREFAARTGKPMGVLADNSPYWLAVRDLMEGGFGYARVIYPAATNGAVCIPRDHGRFGLLRMFRHPPRLDNSLEFPRGFNDKDLSPEENIRRELEEEMGAVPKEVRALGVMRQDTGLCSGAVHVFVAEIETCRPAVGREGIRELLWLTAGELAEKVKAGLITDGFTLSALTLLRIWEGREV